MKHLFLIMGLGLCLGFFSCASMVNQDLDPDTIYRRDIVVTINGEKFVGTGVPKKADKYEMEIKAKGVINMMTISTCHREVQMEYPDPSWFQKGNVQKWTYVPVKGIEDVKGCMMEIGSFEKGKGRHGWAAIDFLNGFESVPATLQCDGVTRSVGPVSICQAKEGLVQKIIFDRRMKVAPDRDECKVLRTIDEKTYTFQMPSEECTYYFGDIEGKFHRLTLIGYKSILVRQ